MISVMVQKYSGRAKWSARMSGNYIAPDVAVVMLTIAIMHEAMKIRVRSISVSCVTQAPKLPLRRTLVIGAQRPSKSYVALQQFKV